MKTQQQNEANNFFFTAILNVLLVLAVLAMVVFGSSVAHAEECYQIVQEVRDDHVIAEVRPSTVCSDQLDERTGQLKSEIAITYDNHPELRPKPREAVSPDDILYKPE
jgi:hypothetical protein